MSGITTSLLTMSEKKDQLVRIAEDLEEYVKAFCPCSEDGKFNDLSSEKCNDAFLMLQEAINDLSAAS